MGLKDITKKLLKGDIRSLFESASKNHLHPVEVAQVLNSLPAESVISAFISFSFEGQVEILPYLDSLVQKKLIQSVPKDNAVKLLNALSSDDRVAFFSGIPHHEIGDFLDYLDEKNKKATLDILGFPKQSVARLINTQFATVKKEMTIAEANEYLSKHQPDTETANVIYVVDQTGKLIDDIPVRRLVLNDPKKKIEEIMDYFCLRLNINDSKEDAIEKFKEYDRTVLPVTNENDVLMGVVTIDDVLDEEEKRNTREMQRFGGMESLEYPYVKTSIFSLIKKERAG